MLHYRGNVDDNKNGVGFMINKEIGNNVYRSSGSRQYLYIEKNNKTFYEEVAAAM